jgi:hypothetical protein
MFGHQLRIIQPNCCADFSRSALATAPDNDWPKTFIDNQVVTMAKHNSLCCADHCQLWANKNPTISGEVS